jgi:transposase InsO family protein
VVHPVNKDKIGAKRKLNDALPTTEVREMSEKERKTIQAFATRAAARLAIFEFIEVWYNRQRLHSSLGYSQPSTV